MSLVKMSKLSVSLSQVEMSSSSESISKEGNCILNKPIPVTLGAISTLKENSLTWDKEGQSKVQIHYLQLTKLKTQLGKGKSHLR